jgi:hypothetical protein
MHPEYFRAVRKWQVACSFSLFSEGLFLITNALSANWFVKWLAAGLALVMAVFAVSFSVKWLSVTKNYSRLDRTI